MRFLLLELSLVLLLFCILDALGTLHLLCDLQVALSDPSLVQIRMHFLVLPLLLDQPYLYFFLFVIIDLRLMLFFEFQLVEFLPLLHFLQFLPSCLQVLLYLQFLVF